ncbi:MAG: hypothetical protein Udaeo2_12410 [Candidatus Udaeobacter sp.]|nr:MAG: hypothetical protein Udaeo2_12410 [Candidatus Udaeobacter sp.]
MNQQGEFDPMAVPEGSPDGGPEFQLRADDLLPIERVRLSSSTMRESRCRMTERLRDLLMKSTALSERAAS